jgi:hypothetical protein
MFKRVEISKYVIIEIGGRHPIKTVLPSQQNCTVLKL